MKAVQLDQFGPAENFQLVDIPIPEPKSDEILIKTAVAGIIFADTQMRSGDYVNLPSLPFIPGREVAGVVVKMGQAVKQFQPAMRVSASMHTGGYAEFAVAQEKNVIPLPDRVSSMQAIAYHINLRIAYLNYYTFGKTEPNDTILLHAAAGGIGSLTTQIAKRRAKNIVIALSSSDEKCAHCTYQGADFTINYKKMDYVKEVLRITDGVGVDVCFNSVGGWTFKTDPHVIKPLGHWVIYGYAAGKDLIDPYEVIMPKSLSISINSVYTVREREEYKEATDFMMDWLRTEELDSVAKTFPLEEVIQAHRWIEDQHSIGKIALVV